MDLVERKENEVAQLCLTLCNPMDYSLPGSSIHWVLLLKPKFQSFGYHFSIFASSAYHLCYNKRSFLNQFPILTYLKWKHIIIINEKPVSLAVNRSNYYKAMKTQQRQ